MTAPRVPLRCPRVRRPSRANTVRARHTTGRIARAALDDLLGRVLCFASLTLLVAVMSASARADERHAMRGVVLKVDAAGRTIFVTVAGKRLRFVVPARLRPGAAVLRRATRVYDGAQALTIDERLASAPGKFVVTVFHERPPDRIAYRIVASSQPGIAGTQVVVIGTKRWERVGNGPWRLTPQSTLHVPRTYWTSSARNVYFSGADELTFYDPAVRAWYRLRLDAAGRPAELKMVGGAHFMHHDYSFRSPPISPPSR